MNDDLQTAPEEVLPQPPGPGRWIRWSAVGLVAAGVLAAFLMRTGGSDGTRAAPDSGPPSATAAPSRPMSPAQLELPPICPRGGDGQVACTTYRSVPAAFRRAVRDLLPCVVVDHAVTQMLRPTGPEVVHGLWSRVFTGHAGVIRIRVVVERRVFAGAAEGLSLTTGRAVVYSRAITPPYTVQVELDAPARLAPPPAPVAELAGDRRLVRGVGPGRGTLER